MIQNLLNFGEGPVEWLFNPKSPLALTTDEVTTLNMYIMTSTKFGSLGAKWEIAGFLMADLPVLQRRLKARVDYNDVKFDLSGSENLLKAGKAPKTSGSTKTASAPKTAEELADMENLKQAYAKADALSTVVGDPIYSFTAKDYANYLFVDPLKRLMNRMAGSRMSKSAREKVLKDIQRRIRINELKNQKEVEAAITGEVSKSQRLAGKRAAGILTLVVAGFLTQDEIDYQYDRLKRWWEHKTRQELGVDQIVDENSFLDISDKIKSSDLLSEEDVKEFEEEFEAAFEDSFGTLESINAKAQEYEEYEECKTEVLNMISSEESFDEELKERVLEINDISKKFGMDKEFINSIKSIEDSKIDDLIHHIENN